MDYKLFLWVNQQWYVKVQYLELKVQNQIEWVTAHNYT